MNITFEWAGAFLALLGVAVLVVRMLGFIYREEVYGPDDIDSLRKKLAEGPKHPGAIIEVTDRELKAYVAGAHEEKTG